ncbi:hypothetical protein HOLleu_37092 [Holothuria leucospilota]|uniref:Uncharacterized protein n=1 Tax=Holothuria leucospilota TaxID=206669 RepID=A0A9Q1BC38_HOLLE|nr:hypothetical protein HOLleu_37092 [Holothuria leucospilota]
MLEQNEILNFQLTTHIHIHGFNGSRKTACNDRTVRVECHPLSVPRRQNLHLINRWTSRPVTSTSDRSQAARWAPRNIKV